MQRKSLRLEDLVAAIRTASEATGETALVIVGTGALIGTCPEAPSSLTYTEDVDFFLEHETAREDLELIDSQIGDGSPFHLHHDFYIQRVGSWTVMDQPDGWRDRATVIEIAGITATLLGPLDLAYNKLNAGREKDVSYVAALLAHNIVAPSDLEAFIRAGSPHYRLEENLSRFREALAASESISQEEEDGPSYAP